MIQVCLFLLLTAARAEEPGDGAPDEPTEEPDAPTEEPAEATEEPAEATEEPAEATEEPAVPTEEPDDAPTEEPAAPAEEPVPEPEPVDDSFGGTLERAKSSYFDGGHEEALVVFLSLSARLAAGEEVDREQAAEALTYLGEVQYKAGDQSAAWDTFTTLLERDPESTISPYHHPTDVVAWFELVRRQVVQGIGPTEPPPPEPTFERLPAWGYLPFGVPQLKQGKPGRAALYGSLQGVFGAGSIGLWFYADAVNFSENHDNEENLDNLVNTRRLLFQWPVTLGFYLTWLSSNLDARQAWRAEHPRPAVVVFVPGDQGGGSFVLSSRF